VNNTPPPRDDDGGKSRIRENLARRDSELREWTKKELPLLPDGFEGNDVEW